MERAKIIYEVIGENRNVHIVSLENFLDAMELTHGISEKFISYKAADAMIIDSIKDAEKVVSRYFSAVPYFINDGVHGSTPAIKIVTDISAPNAYVLQVGSFISAKEFSSIVSTLKLSGNRLSKILRKFKPPVTKALEI
jgi:hypothetical protein